MVRAARGTTLLEAVLAIGVAASAVALAVHFAISGLAISSDLRAQQDFDAASRRIQREFVADMPSVTRFFFGIEDPATGQVFQSMAATSQELTAGYVNRQGQEIWFHYVGRASASTGKIYLLKTSNERDGETYQTQVLASDLESLTFTFYDGAGSLAVRAADIKRVDLKVALSNSGVKRTVDLVGVLRGANQGAIDLPAGVEFDSIEDANFIK